MNTGETIEAIHVLVPAGSRVITPQEKRNRERYIALQQQKQLRRRNNLGTFFFIRQENSFSEIASETVTRLVFLASYAAYESGRLETAKKRPIKKADLGSLLRLSRSTTARFWESVKDIYMYEREDGCLYMDPSVFRKGALGKVKASPFSKVYTRTIRTLYNKVPPTAHRDLGYVFQLLPFISLEYNILCINPGEKHLEDVIPLSAEELCRELGYDYNHFSRLRKRFRRLIIEADGRMEAVVSFISNGTQLADMKVFVNPNVIYNGTNPEAVRILGKFSEVRQL